MKSVNHHKLGESSPPSSYTIMDMAVIFYTRAFIKKLKGNNFKILFIGIFD